MVEKKKKKFWIECDIWWPIFALNLTFSSLNRWGPNFQDDYKNNLKKLLQCVKSVLAEDGMFIWLTAQPGSI